MDPSLSERMLEKIPKIVLEDLLFLSRKLRDNGKEAYLVGGSVRDLAMGRIPHEYDFTTNALPQEIKNIFKRVIDTGIRHGTVTVLLNSGTYEVTTYRKDGEYSDGRRPDTVQFGATLSEDLKRRDFTMNALALNVLSGTLVDEHKGLNDIEAGLIRTIGDPVERFTEDGLRPVRAIRFTSTLGFTIHEKTKEAILKTHSITGRVSIERFQQELVKILKSTNPEVALQGLFDLGIFSIFLRPEILNSVFTSDKLSLLIPEPLGLRLGILFSRLIQTAAEVPEAIHKLKFSNQDQKDAEFFIRQSEILIQHPLLSRVQVKKWLIGIIRYCNLEKIPEYKSAIFSLFQFLFPENYKFADAGSSFSPEALSFIQNSIEEILSSGEPLVLKQLVVNGDWLKTEFPQMDKRKYGDVLRRLLDFVIEYPEKNQPETLKGLIQNEKWDQ